MENVPVSCFANSHFSDLRGGQSWIVRDAVNRSAVMSQQVPYSQRDRLVSRVFCEGSRCRSRSVCFRSLRSAVYRAVLGVEAELSVGDGRKAERERAGESRCSQRHNLLGTGEVRAVRKRDRQTFLCGIFRRWSGRALREMYALEERKNYEDRGDGVPALRSVRDMDLLALFESASAQNVQLLI